MLTYGKIAVKFLMRMLTSCHDLYLLCHLKHSSVVAVYCVALLYQILSLHSKILMTKSRAELWSNVTGLSVGNESKRSVDY